jgi:colanic acid/amylovoran biosynthesis protein
MTEINIVITNVFGPLNRGDHELFGTLLKVLQRPNTKISAIARDPELCAKFFPDVEFYDQLGKAATGLIIFQLVRRIIYLILAILSVYVPALKYALPESQRLAIEKIREADIIIGCPGGFLEDSRFSLYPQLVQLLIPVLLQRKLILAPMSIGPIQYWLPRVILKFILQRADRIYVREEVSKSFCASLNSESIVSNDLAFLNFKELTEKHTINQSQQPEYIAATIIDWSFYSSQNPGIEKQKYNQRIIDLLNDLYTKLNLPIMLIVQVASDLATIEVIKAELSIPCKVLYNVDTPEAIKEILDNSFCLIASRFHSAIFALCIGCPVIALSYLPKTSGMLELYELSELCYPIEDFNSSQLSDALIKMGNHRSDFREKSERLKSNLEKVGNPFVDHINSLLTEYAA